MPLHTSIKNLMSICLVASFSLGWHSLSAAQTQPAANLVAGQIEDSSQQLSPQQEVLRTFEREAKAAYSEAQRTCSTLLNAQDKEICLAKARLQFDADMRYAQKRAGMGH